MSTPNLMDIADRSVAHLAKKGAKESAVSIGRGRSIECEIREKKVEKLQESASASMSVAVYADGKYSGHSTNDLRWESVERFLDNALAMTKILEPDPFRTLPDPKLYANRPTIELGMNDPGYAAVETAARKKFAREIEDAALAQGGEIQSVSTAFSDGWGESIRVTSNGFKGHEEYTSFSAYGRRQGVGYRQSRFLHFRSPVVGVTLATPAIIPSHRSNAGP